MQDFDIVIRAGHLLPISGDKVEVSKDMLVATRGAKIAKISPWTAEGWAAREFIDASDKIVMPGLVNAHTHLSMSLFRGLADDLPFDEWLNKNILPLEARLVSPEFVKLGTELSILEGFLSGTTTFYDMYYFEDSIAEVIEESGARGVVGETVFDYVAPDNKAQDGGDYRILDAMIERWGKHDRVKPFIAPHAPYSCSDETLKRARSYAEKHDLLIGIHVSETKAEFDGAMKQYKKSPVQRLKDLGLTRENSVFAHCVHLTPEDIATLAKANTSAVHNPECNMKLGSGIAPVAQMLAAGVNVGLGTDGPASNNDINMFGEMDCAAKLQKLANASNTALTASTALQMATRNSAKALGLGEKTGSIDVGKYADLLIVDAQSANMQPLHNVASQLVYATTGAEVETVLCHGQIVVRNRVAQTIDAEDLFERIAQYRKKVGL